MYRSILVPIDGSPLSEYALSLAQELARRSNAALHLAHVHIPQTVPLYTAGLPLADKVLRGATTPVLLYRAPMQKEDTNG